MPAKTNLDLHLSASEAARKALSATSPYQVETDSLAAFNADNNDSRDWEVWKQSFTERYGHFQMLATQPSPSAAADAKAAKAATIAKPAAT